MFPYCQTACLTVDKMLDGPRLNADNIVFSCYHKHYLVPLHSFIKVFEGLSFFLIPSWILDVTAYPPFGIA